MRLIVPLAAWLWLAGCVESPKPSNSPGGGNTAGVGDAYGDAELVSGNTPGRHTAIGKGESMAPIYTEDSVLVFNPITYAELRSGMNVAYVNSEGRRVVHCLIEKTGAGWTVLGLNNHRIDSELVTPVNLLGVVYVRFDPLPDDALPKSAPLGTAAAGGK